MIMTGVVASPESGAWVGGRSVRRLLTFTAPGAIALVASAMLCAWVVHKHPATAPDFTPAAPTAATIAAKVASNPYGALIDPAPAPSAAASATETQLSAARVEEVPADTSAPLETPLPPKRDFSVDDSLVPLPPPRPPVFTRMPAQEPERRSAQVGAKVPVVATPPDNRNFLEKLFGLPASPPVTGAPVTSATRSRDGAPIIAAAPTSPGVSVKSRDSAPTTVAYAPAAESSAGRGFGGILGALRSATASPSSRYDHYTAVYDISAHVVYLPDGTRLEAHSGLGNRLDDPHHVDERMRGATPPHVYELSEREGSFHGVQALRLTPVGDGAIFGRAGLLAHPFMLGPNGDSNGCVSFRDYETFRRAFLTGQVKKLAVVASLN